MVLGGGMVWTGAGTLPGIGLIAIGLDQIATGSMNIRYGRVGQGFSVIKFGVYSATGNETVAILTPGVFSLGFGSLGSIGRLGVRGAGAGSMGMPAFRLEDGLYRGALMFQGVGTLTAAEVAAARASVGWWTLGRLRLGWDVRVPAIAGSVAAGFHHSSIPAALLQRLANITAVTRRESGLLLLENGRIVIRLGKVNRFSTTGARWVFAHTHPNGFLTLSFRGEELVSDVAVLSALRQPWTIIVGPRGEAVVWTTLSRRGYNYWGDGVDLFWLLLRGGR